MKNADSLGARGGASAVIEPGVRRREWDLLSDEDPLWTVLWNPDKRRDKWDVDEFFRLGEKDISRTVARFGECGFDPPSGRALDFGCGVGRLVQALALHYSQVDGVDISESMIKYARRFNRRGDAVRYHANDRFDLRLFPDDTFDLVHTIMVLQHMESMIALGYLREFVRVTRPGGVIVFQIPAGYAPTMKGRALALVPGAIRPKLRRWIRRDTVDMHTTPRTIVERTLDEAGADLIHVYADGSTGPHYVNWCYFARKRS